MNIQQYEQIIKVIGDSSIIQGGMGGLIGAFLTVAAHYFISVGVNFTGLGRKILYILSGALVGMLFNYHTQAGILYAAMVGGGWPVFVASFRTAARTVAESLVKTMKPAKGQDKKQE
jgi:hypothetical protein